MTPSPMASSKSEPTHAPNDYAGDDLGGGISTHSRINRNYFSLKSLQLCWVVLIIVGVSAFPVLAVERNNVVVRESVSKLNREELTYRLRAITGWTDLAFDDDGALKIGNAIAREGSKTARDLLNRAFSGGRVILFEDASSRKDVVFCRVVLGAFDDASVAGSDVYVVLIDFADFHKVTGDKPARAAFNVGFAVLHEIDHVVEDSEDPRQDGVGDCEGRINQIRHELGLPVRNSYFFSFLPLKNQGNLVTRFVRLGFDQDNATRSRKRRYWLIWDAAVVGGLDGDESFLASLDVF